MSEGRFLSVDVQQKSCSPHPPALQKTHVAMQLRNTVMDENKKLCLNSGEIIASRQVQILADSQGLGFRV